MNILSTDPTQEPAYPIPPRTAGNGQRPPKAPLGSSQSHAELQLRM